MILARPRSFAVAIRPPVGRWKVFGIVFGALLVPTVLWGLASPLGSVPDEPSHAIRAGAVVRGEVRTGPWSENTALARADVPQYLAHLHQETCYILKPTVTPACERAVTGNQNATVTTGETAGANSPVYYAIVGLPTLVLGGDVAIYAMRMLNAALVAAAFAVMIMQLTSLPRSRWAIAGAVVAFTPMVFFLGGSINPNAIEAASAGALLATFLAIGRAADGPRLLWERALLSIVLTTLLLSGRSISLLWLLIVVCGALAVTPRANLLALSRKPAFWALFSGTELVALLSFAWFSNPPTYATPSDFVAPGRGQALLSMILRSFDFADGYVGVFGWLDTPSPTFSIIVWSFATVTVILAALVWGSGRARWVAACLGGLLLMIPVVLQTLLAPSIGYFWQGRYMLAIFVCFLVCCGIALDNSFGQFTVPPKVSTALGAVLGLLLVGQVASFLWTLRRYVVGSRGSVFNMFFHPSWQPPGGWIALTVLMSIWAAIAFILVYRSILRTRIPTPLLKQATTNLQRSR